MNALTARAVSLAIVVVVWTAIFYLAKLPLQLWVVIVGIACFVGSGSGMSGLQKSVAATASGVLWALLGSLLAGALGRNELVYALVVGAVMFALVAQARLPLLSYTAGAIAGAGVAMGAGVGTIEGGLRVAVALLIGVALGFVAESIAGRIKTRGR